MAVLRAEVAVADRLLEHAVVVKLRETDLRFRDGEATLANEHVVLERIGGVVFGVLAPEVQWLGHDNVVLEWQLERRAVNHLGRRAQLDRLGGLIGVSRNRGKAEWRKWEDDLPVGPVGVLLASVVVLEAEG